MVVRTYQKVQHTLKCKFLLRKQTISEASFVSFFVLPSSSTSAQVFIKPEDGIFWNLRR